MSYVPFYWHLESEFLLFSNKEEFLVYCKYVRRISIGVQKDWRLFIDSSTRSLKEVLLHNTIKLGSISIAHSVNMSEKYESLRFVLEKIQYIDHNWQICEDLKILTILLGQSFTERT